MEDGAQKSCVGLKAYKRYCDYTRTPIDLTPSNQSFRLGNIVHHSLGSTVIRLPTDSAGNYLEYETDVLYVDLPVLVGLDNMKKHRRYINEVTNEFSFQDDPKVKVKLKMKLRHLYLEWPEPLIFLAKQNYSGSMEDLRTRHPETLLL